MKHLSALPIPILRDNLGLFTVHRPGEASLWCLPTIHCFHQNRQNFSISIFPVCPLFPCIHQVGSGVEIEIKTQVSGQDSPWGLSPAAACGVGCVFFWPLQGHCDKSDTGLLRRGAVESQAERRVVSLWVGTRTRTEAGTV